MQKQRSYAPFLIILGMTLMLTSIGQLGGGNVAWADGTYYQTVPTRTPTPDVSGGDNNDSSEPSSEIMGQVIDASTGSPGAGVLVRLNDIEVRTDTFGKYSLSGLSAGQFTVALVLDSGAVTAKEPIVVTVDGQTNVSVDLTYYSNPSDANTAPPPAEAAENASPSDANPAAVDASAENEQESSNATQSRQTEASDPAPQRLPTTGGINLGWFILFGSGFISLLLGLKLHQRS